MRKFLVDVNGTSYQVDVEEISAEQAVASQARTAAPVAVPVPSEGELVCAPMPGTILSVSVKVGDQVKRGDTAMILEAMKMENEIMVPVDGKVTAIHVAAGASVDTGAALFAIG